MVQPRPNNRNLYAYNPAEGVNPGTAQVNPDAVNEQPTQEQIDISNGKKARDKEAIGDLSNVKPGTVQIDPVMAGFGDDLASKNIWQGMRADANRAYRTTRFGYNPYQASAGPQLGQMNYNPYQSAAHNAASSSASTGLAGSQGQLQRTGGLSAADRIRGFSDFNRQKILGQLGGAQQYDQAASQNRLDTSRFNADRANTVARANAGAVNQANRDKAVSNLGREQNLYEGASAERNLQRQLDAASIISAAQEKGGDTGGIFDKILSPIFNAFGGK